MNLDSRICRACTKWRSVLPIGVLTANIRVEMVMEYYKHNIKTVYIEENIFLIIFFLIPFLTDFEFYIVTKLRGY